MCKQMQGSRVKPVRMGVLALTIVLIAVTVPAGGADCPPDGAQPTVPAYDHEKGGDKSYDPVDVDPGEQIIVEIRNTCAEAFKYAYKPFDRVGAPRGTEASANGCTLETVYVCITHEAANGAYLVDIAKKEDSDVTTDLEPAQLIIPVKTDSWDLGFSSGPTISKLTDPVFAVDTQTIDGEEKSVLVRDRAAEDDENLGLAAFGHVSRGNWFWGAFKPGLSVGLGLDERNEASYYLGFGVRMGDKALVTLGHAWGSTKRLPSGLAVGDFVDDANVLNDLPTHIQGDWFFSVSFGLASGKDKFINKLKIAGGDKTKIGK